MPIQLNIHNRLALVLWSAALLAFIVAGAGFMLLDRFTLETRARQIMEPYAQLVSVGADAAVDFEDPLRAQEILDTLQANSQILEAEIFLANGRVLASFSRMPNAHPLPLPGKPDGISINKDTAELLQSLPRGAHLHLSMSLDRLSEQTHQGFWVLGAGMLFLLTTTFGQLAVLRRTIVRPLASLTETTELVQIRADYKHRVPASGTDEVARLGQSFNAMMEAIQLREDELHRLTRFQRTILDNAAHVIISTDYEGMITSFNPAAERLLGYTAGEVIGKQTPALWHDADEIARYARQLSEELGETVSAGFDVFVALPQLDRPEEHEWTFIRKDGSRIPVFLSVTALRDESTRITGFLGLAYDLTERKRAEDILRRYKDQLEETVQQRTTELLQARDAAEAANKAKSTFLANMSHELRTPLNAILGFSNIMRRDPQISASQSENLDIINRSGEHLLSLINDVLDMAKIEAGHLQLDIVPFDLGGMVLDVTEMMRVRAHEKGLQLLLDQSTEFPRYLWSDEARLRQILINLINNAIKFTQQGEIIVRLGFNSDNYRQLLIEVEDSGPGIAPDDQHRLFDPFVQLTESATQRGTGLGLTITRQFVQMLDGRIGVESTLGKGSLFRVELPVELANAADILNPAPHEYKEVVGLAPGQPKFRILIAEDQHENQLLLSHLMTSIGLEAKIAENGQQCLEIFRDWHPDLIWMDRRMPVMDGIAATQRIRRLPEGQTVKIIAVTASAFKEQQQEMLNAGMDDFVRKPYHFEEIYETMARQLGFEYLYRTDHAMEEPQIALTISMFELLPAALRNELREALTSLEIEKIANIIEQIAEIDIVLSHALFRLAENYDYPAILTVLDRLDEN